MIASSLILIIVIKVFSEIMKNITILGVLIKSNVCGLEGLIKLVYIGDVFMAKMPVTAARDSTCVLALATLAGATKIEMILSLLGCPRWPRQVQ